MTITNNNTFPTLSNTYTQLARCTASMNGNYRRCNSIIAPNCGSVLTAYLAAHVRKFVLASSIYKSLGHID